MKEQTSSKTRKLIFFQKEKPSNGLVDGLLNELGPALLAPEEEGDGSRTRVAADDGADGIDEDLTLHMGEFGLDFLGDGFGEFRATGHAHVDLPVVIKSLIRELNHLLDHAALDFAFPVALLPDDKFAFVVHV